MVGIVAGAEPRVVIQRRNRARQSGGVMETVGSGNGACVTKTVEVNEVDRRVGVAEGAGGGGRGRNGGQTPVAGSRLLRQDTGVLAIAGSELDITQEGCSIYVTIRGLLYAKEMTFRERMARLQFSRPHQWRGVGECGRQRKQDGDG